MAGRDTRGVDEPPNSRLFILCQKGITEREFRDAFEQFGAIEDVWIIKDKRTNEDRGIVYIKFSKTSEAMQAMEEMNGRTLPGTTKGLKVVVANSKREGSTRDKREDERLVRLFVIIPKSFTEQNLLDEFTKYGDVESVTVLKNRISGENKGFGYVRFFKPMHAALAYENCSSTFKPKFAEPQRSRDERDEMGNNYYGAGQKRMYEDDFGHGNFFPPDAGFQGNSNFRAPNFKFSGVPNMGASNMNMGPMEMLNDYPTTTTGSRLVIQAPIGLTQGYLAKLFNLIPGMEYCDLNETTGIAYARYTNPQSATYARDKLNGFEYPLGSPLHVQLADDNSRQEYPMNIDGSYSTASQFGNYGQSAMGMDSMDIRQKAAVILEKAGINPHSLLNLAAAGSSGLGSVGDGRKERIPYCNIPLPPPQPTVPAEEDGKNLAQRLFIVCQPSGVPERVLKDAFCRFGNLIDVYLLTGRNYGYAKYASKESAMKAIETLHGQNLGGQKLKVLEAEPPKSHSSSQAEEEGPSKKLRL